MHEVSVGWVTDSHIDYHQYGLDRRRDDFTRAFGWVINDMIQKKVAFAIHTGDVLHSNRPSSMAIQSMREFQRKMEVANLRMYVNQGNHDYAQPSWIRVVNKNSPSGFIDVDYMNVSDSGLRIYGAPNMSREEFLKHSFPDSDILMLHQAVKEFIGFPHPNALAIAELPSKGRQIVAIGDIHVHRIIDDPAQAACVVGYAGSTELNSESEQEDKYWVELIFRDGKLVDWPKHRIPTRPVIRVTINSEEDTDKSIARIIDKINLNLAVDKEARDPMVFVHYLYSVPGVVDRFKQAFNLDDLILRWSPEFAVPGRKGADGNVVELPDNLTPMDILKTMESTDSAIFRPASQALNPDIDFNAAIDTFIDERLKAIDASQVLDTV